ncbi:MAG: peptidylprolyl isomerase [Myxococcota bacterium]
MASVEGCPSPDVDVDALTPWAPPRKASKRLTDPNASSRPIPQRFHLHLQTSEGLIVVELDQAWGPKGVARVHQLASSGYLDGTSFYRVIPGFVAQFGVSPYPQITEAWDEATLDDEVEALPMERGVLAMARKPRPNSRSTQLFFNLANAPFLVTQGYGGIGRVVQGLDVMDRLNGCYGEQGPLGSGPSQREALGYGNAYLRAGWPALDEIEKAWVVEVSRESRLRPSNPRPRAP